MSTLQGPAYANPCINAEAEFAKAIATTPAGQKTLQSLPYAAPCIPPQYAPIPAPK